ncbi:MAG: hypothetical protein ACYCXP_13130 [Leptospirillum sp.]
MASMLIAGRGWPGLAAAIMARSRGYECHLLYDESTSAGALLGGLSGAPLKSWLSLLDLSPDDDLFLKELPSLLYVGKRWELLGVLKYLGKAHEAEQNRFLHGLSLPDHPIFVKIRTDLSESFERAKRYHSLPGKLADWLTYPLLLSKRAFLKRKVRKKSHFPVWEPLFLSLERALGLSAKDCLSVQRIFLDLFEGNLYLFNEQLLRERLFLMADNLGIRLEKSGRDPVEIRNEGRRGFLDLKTGKRFDRFLDLSSSVKPFGTEKRALEIPRSLYPDLWPGTLLIDGDETLQSLFLVLTKKTDDHLMARLHFSGSSETASSRLSDLFPSLFFEIPPEEFSETTVPMVVLSGQSAPLSASGPYSLAAGNLSLLRDPASLPFLDEEWVLSLYEAIPLRKRTLNS